MKYIFGGYVECGGTLEDGTPWKNYRVLAARPLKNGGKPVAANVLKVKGTDENGEFLADIDKARFEGMSPCFTAVFDENGRAVELRTAD